MDTSRSAVSLKLRAQAIDALRRARRLPVGPHRNDLRQLAIGLRSLEMREMRGRTEASVATLASLQDAIAAPAAAAEATRIAS
jgi:hypothetical protein